MLKSWRAHVKASHCPSSTHAGHLPGSHGSWACCPLLNLSFFFQSPRNSVIFRWWQTYTPAAVDRTSDLPPSCRTGLHVVLVALQILYLNNLKPLALQFNLIWFLFLFLVGFHFEVETFERPGKNMSCGKSGLICSRWQVGDQACQGWGAIWGRIGERQPPGQM